MLLKLAQRRKRRPLGIVAAGFLKGSRQRRANIVLGHIRQAEDDLVFNQPQHIEARRTHDALDNVAMGLVVRLLGFELGLGLHHLKKIVDINLQGERLHAALAFEHGCGAGHNPQPLPALRIDVALYRPPDLTAWRLAGQIAHQSRKLHKRRLALQCTPQTGQLGGIDKQPVVVARPLASCLTPALRRLIVLGRALSMVTLRRLLP